MKALLTFISLFCFAIMGYSSGLRVEVAEREKDLIEELSHSSDKTAAKSISYAISVAADVNMRAQGIKPTALTTVESALDQAQLSAHEADLSQVLGNDATGSRFRRALIAENHSSELPGADLYIRNIYEDLKNDPKTGLESLQTALDRIPLSGFPLERTALLNMMGSIGTPNDQVKADALNELTHNIITARPDSSQARTQDELNAVLSTTPDMALPIAAQTIFLKNTSDPMEALSGTVQGIVAQPDKGVQRALAFQFMNQYPNLTGQLNSSLITQGVQLPISVPTEDAR